MREPYFQTGFLRLCWQKLFWLIVWNLLFLLCCLCDGYNPPQPMADARLGKRRIAFCRRL